MVRATLNTMWIIMLTFLPGYLPSVLRGDRSKKLAPARLAIACRAAHGAARHVTFMRDSNLIPPYQARIL